MSLVSVGFPFDIQILTFNLAISSSFGKFFSRLYKIQIEPAINGIDIDVKEASAQSNYFNQN